MGEYITLLLLSKGYGELLEGLKISHLAPLAGYHIHEIGHGGMGWAGLLNPPTKGHSTELAHYQLHGPVTDALGVVTVGHLYT